MRLTQGRIFFAGKRTASRMASEVADATNPELLSPQAAKKPRLIPATPQDVRVANTPQAAADRPRPGMAWLLTPHGQLDDTPVHRDNVGVGESPLGKSSGD